MFNYEWVTIDVCLLYHPCLLVKSLFSLNRSQNYQKSFTNLKCLMILRAGQIEVSLLDVRRTRRARMGVDQFWNRVWYHFVSKKKNPASEAFNCFCFFEKTVCFDTQVRSSIPRFWYPRSSHFSIHDHRSAAGWSPSDSVSIATVSFPLQLP